MPQGLECVIITLPDTMSGWPWPRRIHPAYDEVKHESDSWFRSFGAFESRSMDAFELCNFSLLAALTYPSISKEHLRTGCDLMQLFFVIDEYTDVESAPVCKQLVDIVLDALQNPHKPRPDGEVVLGEITRQFWARAIRSATPTSQRHFLNSFTAYLWSIVIQAEERDNAPPKTVEDYLQNRRNNIGAYPSFVPIELGMDIPDHVFYDPFMKEIHGYVTDMIILDNDIASYNKEQATGDDCYNILTVVMEQNNVDLEAALQWVAKYHSELREAFIEALQRVPTWGDQFDQIVREYIEGIALWPRGNVCWNFESGRYFGGRGAEIQKSLRVPLLPKVPRRDDLHGKDIIVPIIEL